VEYKRVRDGFEITPVAKALTHDDRDPGRNAYFMTTDVEIGDIPRRLVELAGKAGDVFVTHPWVMHAAAPNATNRPRMMRSVAVYHVKYAHRPAERGTPLLAQ